MTAQRRYGRAGAAGAGRTAASGKVAGLVLFALFVLVLLAAIVAGARAYSALVASQDQVRADRLADNLVVNAIRANDAIDAVGATPGPEGDALTLTQRTAAGTFETRIFLSDGVLYQEYSVEGAPLSPATALPIVDTRTFSFSLEGELITVWTDHGCTQAALRCPQPAAQDTEVTYG